MYKVQISYACCSFIESHVHVQQSLSFSHTHESDACSIKALQEWCCGTEFNSET